MNTKVLSSDAVTNSIAVTSLNDIYALSPLQQEIFSRSNSAGFVDQCVRTIFEPVNLTLFRQSWNLLIERHPILRTVFRCARKQPVQIVLNLADCTLAVHDLRGTPPNEQEQVIRRVIEEEAAFPFDLANGPLLRLVLFLREELSCQLLLTYHRIILDRWSVRRLSQQFDVIYGALLKNESVLWEESRPFKDFILWLKRQDTAECLHYWQHSMEDFAAATPLYLDQAHGTGHGRRVAQNSTFAAGLARDLSELGKNRGISANIILKSAWAVLLSRYSGETDVAAGITVPGRPPGLKRIESIAGPFVNVLPLRIRLGVGVTVSELLHAVHQQTVNIGHYSYLSWADVQSAANLPSREKLTSTVFEVTTTEASDGDLRFLRSLIPTDSDVLLAVEVSLGADPVVTVTYDEQVFETSTVKSLLDTFLRIVEFIVANPEARISEFKITSNRERERVLQFGRGAEVNRETMREWPEEQIARQAREHPEKIALRHGQQTLNYAQLNQD
ncbi:MAG TPA: condensation domain-containing protein, partial [Candidatus Angelobacter sp.]|nr:condensation domain-containing protein [Candidatus Angelobacter sp.]